MNRQRVAHANRTYIQANPERRVRHETSEPGLRWIGRSGCRDAKSERGVHDEKWDEYRAHAEEQRGCQGGPRKPAIGNEGRENERINGTNDIVGDPAHRAFERFLRGVGDARVRERALGHVAKPAPDQTIVGQSDAESTLQEQRPKVHEQSRAKANGDCVQSVSCFSTRDLPRGGCSCLEYSN